MSPILDNIRALLGWLAIVLAGLGVAYQLVGALTVRRFFRDPPPAACRSNAVTLLKPLHGAEPRLAENLATFLAQDHAGPLQMVCGVQRADDPAIAIVEGVRDAPPPAQVDLVVDATVHGANAKVSNLVNMMRAASHPILILSDSDIAVPPDYLMRVLGALDQSGVGAVSCLYRGRGDAGFWSRVGAVGLTYQFVVGVVVAAAYRLADPCMGSTIALRRDTLDRIGGFERFVDTLADDHSIGQAVIALGLGVDVPAMIVTHAFDDADFAALWRHELRWAATVGDIAFWSHVGEVIGMPLPLACLACLYSLPIGAGLVAAALIARILVIRAVDAASGVETGSPWLAIAHDFMAFAVYIRSFFVRSVDWRGSRLRMALGGRIEAEEVSPT